MNDIARSTLAQMIQTYGVGLVSDPRRTEALLRDLCGSCRREIFVLSAAQREGIPKEILNARGPVAVAAVVGRLVKRLQTDLGFTEDAARWAVETWAEALGVSIPIGPPTNSPTPPQGRPVASASGAGSPDPTSSPTSVPVPQPTPPRWSPQPPNTPGPSPTPAVPRSRSVRFAIAKSGIASVALLVAAFVPIVTASTRLSRASSASWVIALGAVAFIVAIWLYGTVFIGRQMGRRWGGFSVAMLFLTFPAYVYLQNLGKISRYSGRPLRPFPTLRLFLSSIVASILFFVVAGLAGPAQKVPTTGAEQLASPTPTATTQQIETPAVAAEREDQSPVHAEPTAEGSARPANENSAPPGTPDSQLGVVVATTSNKIALYALPSLESTQVRVLCCGARIQILSEPRNGWVRVQSGSGVIGWVQLGDIEHLPGSTPTSTPATTEVPPTITPAASATPEPTSTPLPRPTPESTKVAEILPTATPIPHPTSTSEVEPTATPTAIARAVLTPVVPTMTPTLLPKASAIQMLPEWPPLAHGACFFIVAEGPLSFETTSIRLGDIPGARSILSELGWSDGAYRQFGCDFPPQGSAGWIEVNAHVFPDSWSAQQAVSLFGNARAAGTSLIQVDLPFVGDDAVALIGPASNGTEYTIYASENGVLFRVTGVSRDGNPASDVLEVMHSLLASISRR